MLYYIVETRKIRRNRESGENNRVIQTRSEKEEVIKKNRKKEDDTTDMNQRTRSQVDIKKIDR